MLGQARKTEGVHLTMSGSGEDECVFQRSSQDSGSNAFVTVLLNLCSALQCSILSGIKTFGFVDSETYVSQISSSTIDYLIVSNDLCLCKPELLESFVADSSCVESDHLPVSLTPDSRHGHQK